MKVLFVGEGNNDIGEAGPDPYVLRTAGGTVALLARKVCTSISSDSVALPWTGLPRLKEGLKKGFASKLQAAVLVASRRYGCSGTIAFADRDRQEARADELEKGAAQARHIFPGHRVAWGLAVESVEAWTLAVPESIAEELGVDPELVRNQYPAGLHVESMYERSGKQEHRPKLLLERIAQLKHRSDSTGFRQAVAERTDIAALEKACPKGFRPFAAALRSFFQ